ncbi:flagellin N-terminal helical domain-containing protein [Streptomyces melanogenes]|uniref:flagellin N-terminal helical domain-containing protein n=1 Tax=Streptomyces melanogenes TaxID=67326 RepID=UPI001992C4AA|nr:hypothetical protein [Streptomyces melanogenes]GGP95407.1 hypothetical protein GCM10010278_86480 [Streptomyces melanogenes]
MTSNEEEPSGQLVAVRAADAIAIIQTTEGWLNEVTSVLQRMRVLSIQSANGTHSEEDRSAIQLEVDQLTDEIARVADQAGFNRLKTLRVHVGTNTNEALAVNIFAANVQHLFAGEPAAPADQGAATPADQQGGAGAQGGAAVAGPVNVMTAIDANSSIAKIDVAIRFVTDQRSNLGAFQNRLESAIRRSSAGSATDAAGKLLEAIGAEAQRVADKSAGQASAELVELARAYARVLPPSEALNSLGNFWQALGDKPRSVHAESAAGAAAPASRNMITGTSQADVAMLVVPAEKGGFEGAFSRTSQTQLSAADARDRLLDAIGREAQLVAESPGQTATTLTELARAYALVAPNTAAIAVPALQARAGEGRHSISLVAHVPTNGFYVVPTDADLINKDQDMSFSPITEPLSSWL